MSIPYHDETTFLTERMLQAALDRLPCTRCGGDRLRPDFTGSGRCHTVEAATPDPAHPRVELTIEETP